MRSILLVAAFFAALPSFAILIRPDRDDAEYLELATRYPAAVQIAPRLEGVLIAPRWVLTTAKCAMLLQGAKSRPPLAIGGKRNEILRTFMHPAWDMGSGADIALVLLSEPVSTIEPLGVSADAEENDETVFVVGHGQTGKLGDGVRRVDGRKRAAINTVDRVLPGKLGLRIKPPDSASDLQGGPAPNEYGAPALMESMGRTYVVGLFSVNEGEWQVFTRVSTYIQWISDTMFKAAVEEANNVKRAPGPGPR